MAAPRASTGAVSPHADSIEWLATQPGLLTDCAGEWVALDRRTIVAHDPSVVEVVRQASERGVADPLLVPVPPRSGPIAPSPFVVLAATGSARPPDGRDVDA